MTRLLNKPLKAFSVFAVVILACSIPAYFFLIESIWTDELDDHNAEIKRQIQQGFSDLPQSDLANSIRLWNRVHPESAINSVERPQKDSVYTIEKEIVDNGIPESERFRGFLSGIELHGNLYSVRIVTNVEEVHETVTAISVVTCSFIIILIIGFVLLNRQLSKTIWKPFTNTLDKLKQFDLNSTTGLDFEKTEIREFSELNATLEKLIRNNVQAYQQQKEFAQNASHELQTPLALLKSKLDLLIQNPGLSPDQRSIIESLDSSVSRITRINKNLLLLARIENMDYTSSPVDLSSMLSSLTELFSSENGNEITTARAAGVQVNANDSLTEIMINNLLSNAMRHSPEASPILVDLSKTSLSIKNSGKHALKSEALFKRFISVDAQSQGTGLGLAIVKEICDKYGWKITYSFSQGQHIFSVVF
jgi:signal transduction histidine kinase